MQYSERSFVDYQNTVDDEYDLPETDGTVHKNPYEINRHNVKMGDFRDARSYDSNIDDGWQIQKGQARGKYKNWVKSVRQLPDWQDFKRDPREVTYEDRDEDGNIVETRVRVFPRVPCREDIPDQVISQKTYTPTSKKWKKDPTAVEPEIVEELFTLKMGKRIAEARSRKGMKQVELARKLNVNVTVVKEIEIGDKVTFSRSSELVVNLERILEIEIEYTN